MHFPLKKNNCSYYAKKRFFRTMKFRPTTTVLCERKIFLNNEVEISKNYESKNYWNYTVMDSDYTGCYQNPRQSFTSV